MYQTAYPMENRQARDRRRSELQREIGKTVKGLREERGLTLQALADGLGRPRQFAWRLEEGHDVRLTPDVIEDLSDVLKVRAEEILAPLLLAVAKERGHILTALKSDPRMVRRRAASHRLSVAAMAIPDAELESVANIVEARAEVLAKPSGARKMRGGRQR
jgi:transcriptional regulator with XRE-family HTH domain